LLGNDPGGFHRCDHLKPKLLIAIILTYYNNSVINKTMKPHEFKSARLEKGWTQTQAAAHMAMTQAYLNYLENGKRRLTPELVRRATSVYGLSPEVLPVADTFTPRQTDDQRLTELLARLGYPGFSYLRAHTLKKHPSEVLLTALAQKSLDVRVAEALPWVAMKYAQPQSWLVENARRFNLQNRLGFVVSLARRVAELRGEGARSMELSQLENMLDDSRLAREDVFYRPSRTEGETEWLRKNRTEDAMHWNLLTDMRPEHLQYAS
jgi:transcriptional regulator with XRE-family HTH domain